MNAIVPVQDGPLHEGGVNFSVCNYYHKSVCTYPFWRRPLVTQLTGSGSERHFSRTVQVHLARSTCAEAEAEAKAEAQTDIEVHHTA